MPYFVAFYVFECATLVAFILTMRAILRAPGWLWAGPVLAFPPVFWAFGLGQNTFLTAALFGWFTLLLERRPALAGAVLGMLCYKPHFGILVPAALACAGYWRTFLAAGAAVGVLIGLSVLLFGIDTWHAYLTAFAASDKIYATGKVDFAGMITPFGAARLLGIEQSGAYLTQTVFTASMVIAVGLVWRRTTNPVSRNGVLLAGTLLAVPMALLYDQLVLMVAIGWMAREAKSHGFLPWEKTCLAAMYLTALLAYAIGSEWKLPLFPLISAALLGLAIRRTGWIMRTRGPGTVPANKLAMGANGS